MKPTIELRTERAVLASDAQTIVQLLVRVRTPYGQPQDRPTLNLGLSIDRSGSMSGDPLNYACRAAEMVIAQLTERDAASVVAFDDIAVVLSPCQAVLDRRPIVDRLRKLVVGGSTNLFGGWQQSADQVAQMLAERNLSRVILLSDGQANVGITALPEISEAVRRWCARGISTTTVGLGLHYNEDLLSAIAEAGNGSFYHVNSPDEIASNFELEMAAMARTYGRQVSLGIEPAPGVEVLQVYNPVSQTPKGRFMMADLVQGQQLDLVVELRVPPGRGHRAICGVRLGWTSVRSSGRDYGWQEFGMDSQPATRLDEFPIDREVAVHRALQISSRALAEAVQLLGQREQEKARLCLEETLATLSEGPDHRELKASKDRLKQLLAKLQAGRVGEVRKQASSDVRSVSMGSFSFSPFARQFLALPVEERTKERLEQILRESSGG